MYRSHVLICGGTGCTSSNSEKIIEKMKEEIKARGLENEVNVVRTDVYKRQLVGKTLQAGFGNFIQG